MSQRYSKEVNFYLIYSGTDIYLINKKKCNNLILKMFLSEIVIDIILKMIL